MNIKKLLREGLLENRNQMELPFDGGHPVHDKPTHVHLLDALKDIKLNINTDEFYTDIDAEDIDTMWGSKTDEAFSDYMDFSPYERGREAYQEFLFKYPVGKYPNMYADNFLEMLDDEGIDVDDTDEMIYSGLLEELPIDDFIKNDEKIFNELMTYFRREFENNMEEYDALYSIKRSLNDEGLVTIYRAITLDKGNEIDVYTNMVNYGGIGVFWSFSEDGAYPHCGGSCSDSVVIKGQVKPNHISWTDTIYKSGYHLRDEREVEVLEGVPIKITGLLYRGKNIPLDSPIFVKT